MKTRPKKEIEDGDSFLLGQRATDDECAMYNTMSSRYHCTITNSSDASDAASESDQVPAFFHFFVSETARRRAGQLSLYFSHGHLSPC